MPRVSTGGNLSEALRQESTTVVVPSGLQITIISNPRSSIYLETRGPGAAVTAVSRIFSSSSAHEAELRRRRDPRYSRIQPNDIVEVYIKSSMVIRKSATSNICTPWELVYSREVSRFDEVALCSTTHAVIATPERRRKFVEDTIKIAESGGQPLQKIAALVAMEAYFLQLVSANKIPAAIAERQYDKYEKVASRIWRGTTDGERIAAFRAAWKLLATACELTQSGGN